MKSDYCGIVTPIQFRARATRKRDILRKHLPLSFGTRMLVSTVALILQLLSVNYASAQSLTGDVAVTIVGSDHAGSGGVNKMGGWDFSPSTQITVTALGYRDRVCTAVAPVCADGLVEPHEIGLWDSARNLLAYTIIPIGTAAVRVGAQFRFVPITPITLDANQTYTIAALNPEPDNDGMSLGSNGSLSDFVLDSRISFVGARYKPFVSGFTYPDAGTEYLLPFLGPSFLIGVEISDIDDDGVSDNDDNCPSIANPEQTDTDEDGAGDACDDDAPPAVSGVFAVPSLMAINTSSVLTATVDDSATGGSAITSADYSLDGSTYTPMTADDGIFDNVSEVVTATLAGFTEAGVFDVCVRGTDGPGNTSDPVADPGNACTFVVAYDPSAGFATGGGWIHSAAGACQFDAVCAEAAGKANFGFVSRYKKGATVPTGNTEFQFSAGGIIFHSETYDWLVVNMSGTNAQYKGSGTVNGNLGPAGVAYRFMLWARDWGTTAIDTFRIKIWYVDAGSEVVVYDNGFDQEIGGGNIVVHTK